MEETPKPEEPNIPDTIEDLITSLREREVERRKAVDMALQQYDAAQTEEDRTVAAKIVLRMMDVLEEFRSQFPEVFPPASGENQ